MSAAGKKLYNTIKNTHKERSITMAGEIDFFKQFLYEAPGDDPPPDMIQQDNGGSSPPPDIPEDNSQEFNMNDSDPPDLPEQSNNTDDMYQDPPDMDDSDFNNDEFMDMDDDNGSNKTEDLGLDKKISAVMNQELYQRYLSLLGNVTSQISQMKDNSDILYSITTECTNIIDRLSNLESSIKLYLKNNFINENYSKNLLFFNKCLNLLNLINEIFDNETKKGIKDVNI